MAEELQLSEQLLVDVKATLCQHDESCNDDVMAAQYLSALIGYILGSQQMPREQRRDLLGQLGGFAGQVMEQVEGDEPEPAPAAAPDAFGVWKPDQT